MADLSVYDNDPTLYLFTSLTAGSSHIVTATSRIETILKANKIAFKGVDTATDDLARALYGRRAQGKKLPLLVKEGFVVADLEQIEEWNEYDELKEALGGGSPAPAPVPVPVSAPAQNENAAPQTSQQNLAIRQLGAEAAKVAAAKKHVPERISTTNPLLAEKINSPAISTPSKTKPDQNGSTSSTSSKAILSPRSIPLPQTPTIPKLASKPVHSPPSMHIDAANAALGAPPLSSSSSSPKYKSPLASPRPGQGPLSPGLGSGSGPASPITEFHGSKIGTASEEEIRLVERELTIPEVSSTDEEDSEEERESAVRGDAKRKGGGKVDAKKEEEVDDEEQDEDEEDEDEEEDSEEGEEEEESEESEQTQEQSAKAAEKAGASVED